LDSLRKLLNKKNDIE